MSESRTIADASQVFPPRRVEKPWGYELIWAETERYVGKILHINAGEQLSYQFHERKDETIFVLSGTIDVQVAWEDGPRETVRLTAHQSLRIPPGLRHRVCAVVTADVLEASTPELDDVVRIEDRYGRAPSAPSAESDREPPAPGGRKAP